MAINSHQIRYGWFDLKIIVLICLKRCLKFLPLNCCLTIAVFSCFSKINQSCQSVWCCRVGGCDKDRISNSIALMILKQHDDLFNLIWIYFVIKKTSSTTKKSSEKGKEICHCDKKMEHYPSSSYFLIIIFLYPWHNNETLCSFVHSMLTIYTIVWMLSVSLTE